MILVSDFALHSIEFLLENNTWEALNKEGKPVERNSGSAVYDEKNNRVIVYGGANLSGPLNDLYAYDISKIGFMEVSK